MNKVKTVKVALYISAILFLIAAIRSGYSGNAAIACGCLVLAVLQKK